MMKEGKMEKLLIEKFAKELHIAHNTSAPIKDNITDTYSDFTLADAYNIQLETIKLRINDGEKIIGKKIGFTSEKLRQQYNVLEPDYGILMDTCVMHESLPISMKDLIKPRIEGEIAFILKEDLVGPNITIIDVYRATDFIMPCIEIVDSRFDNWNIKLLDSIADNASNAKVILGSSMGRLEDFDLKHMGMVAEKNGFVMETAAGAAVFGHPANSVAWLANKMFEFGTELKKGDIILSGAFSPVFDVVKGDSVEVSFAGLGSVKASFV